MDRRIDRRTQIHIDAVLNSLPSIGRWKSSILLRKLGVPVEAARVMDLPEARRMFSQSRRSDK